MVKGVSRQVIVVEAPEPKLFEQAIFILKDDMGEGITDEVLLKEAQRALHSGVKSGRTGGFCLQGAAWAAVGALATGLVWLLTWML